MSIGFPNSGHLDEWWGGRSQPEPARGRLADGGERLVLGEERDEGVPRRPGGLPHDKPVS